jgi:glycosyltransferase involved in cell wall biosynthesis
MNYYVIIPAYNEEQFIRLTLDSLLEQTVLPTKVVVVNDNSTDKTAEIVKEYVQKNTWIHLVTITSEAIHLPGSKVINAFNKGYEMVDEDYDIIVKLDADLILPNHYFEKIIAHFKADDSVGMAGGFAYIEKNGEWILENLTDKNHIRGAFKAYTKECFLRIGKLKPAMGWDTLDELTCAYYGIKVITDETLKVKHLKPTGANYNKTARYKQGEAFYTLGYGFVLTAIASIKLAFLKGKPLLFTDYLVGFWKAKRAKKPLLVSKLLGEFIREYRWKKIREKLF